MAPPQRRSPSRFPSGTSRRLGHGQVVHHGVGDPVGVVDVAVIGREPGRGGREEHVGDQAHRRQHDDAGREAVEPLVGGRARSRPPPAASRRSARTRSRTRRSPRNAGGPACRGRPGGGSSGPVRARGPCPRPRAAPVDRKQVAVRHAAQQVVREQGDDDRQPVLDQAAEGVLSVRDREGEHAARRSRRRSSPASTGGPIRSIATAVASR